MEMSDIFKKKIEEEMIKFLGLQEEYLQTASTTSVADNLTLESLQKIIDSIPKPQYITISKHVPDDNRVYIINDEQYTNPNTAKLIIEKEPQLIRFFKNTKLLE